MIETHFYPRAIQALANNSHLEPFDLVGLTPLFLNPNDERNAQEQLHSNYAHGGGWHDFNGFTFSNSETNPQLLYAGDPPTDAVAYWELRDERIILFDHAWVAVIQKDGSFRVARMD